MQNEVNQFENSRWSGFEQKPEFRHKAALAMIKSGRVLDYGCGDGLFLSMLKEKGLAGVGLDISEVAVKKCQEKGLEAYMDYNPGKLAYDDKSFDYVVLLDVLEHLYQPEKILAEAARVGKQVTFSVPNFNSLPARIQVLLGRVPQNNKPNKGHVYWFNLKVIKKMCANNNLEILEFKSHTFWADIPVVGAMMKVLLKLWPGLFGLSFVVKVKEI